MAKEIYTGMIVALKSMDKKGILKDNLLVQFIRELKIQSFLDHPNIIKNYGYFSDEENFYTIMELGCDGQLYDIISSGETLSEESTSYIIGNLLEAINLMHRHKILHRDIKPENIVLVHVKLFLFRVMLNFVISVGQSIKKKSFVLLSAGLLYTYLLSCCREINTMRRSIFGRLAFWHTSCIWVHRLSTSVSKRI